MTIQHLGKTDLELFRELVRLFERVFDETGQDVPLEGLLENPAFIAYAAIDQGKVWGGLTAYVLPSYHHSRPEVFLYDLAIDPDHQREGLGTRLIDALREHSRREGLGEVFVAAHERDKTALEFYRATGGREEKVVHFTYSSGDPLEQEIAAANMGD